MTHGSDHGEHEPWKPRANDHLVEPFFGGLDHGVEPEARPFDSPGRELDPFGEARGTRTSLQTGVFPVWWLWVALAAGAGALWVLW